MATSYTDYVASMTLRNPSLGILSSFLSNEHQTIYNSSIQYIEIDQNGQLGSTRGTSAADLVLQLNSRPTKSVLAVVENVRPEDIEVLGSALGIDPFFFCGHIASSYYDPEKSALSPLLALPPSRIISRGFLNLHYQKVLDLGDESGLCHAPYKLTLESNVPRSARRLPALSGRSMGLLRGCVSLIKQDLPNDLWLCLILLDPVTHIIAHSTRDLSESRIPQVPRRIATESPRELPSYAEFLATVGAKSDLRFLNPCEELLGLYSTRPPGWKSGKPSILSLAYYPIQLVNREWILYGSLMSRYIKYYEYSFPTVSSRLEHFENNDIIELHRWRRRSQHSVNKLQMTRLFVEHWRVKELDFEPQFNCAAQRDTQEEESAAWNLLLMDIHHLHQLIHQHARSLEALSPIMTSLVQLIDSHKSITQAEDVKRLTYIAIAFIPLTYITGIFSMGDPYIPGGRLFWVYWVTAVPIAAFVMGLLVLGPRFPSVAALYERANMRRTDLLP